MGFVDNGNAASNMQSAQTLAKLLAEQIETNRLLRILAAEPEVSWPVSHQPKWHEKATVAKKDRHVGK